MTTSQVAYSQISSNPATAASLVKKPPVSPVKKPPVPPWRTRYLTTFKRSWQSFVHYWWAWEFLAATLSLLATAALIATLVVTDGRPLQSMTFGSVQISLNAFVAAISTVIRTSLLVTVAGPLNQSLWNWFSSPKLEKGAQQQSGKPLKDLDTFGNAAQDLWSSLQLLVRTKYR
jgi:hypothetical protein